MISDTPLSKKANRVWSVTTPPTIEPITLEEVKLFGRIDGAEEDSLLSSLITSVRVNMELYLRRALLSQTLTMFLDYWPGDIIQLPRPPLISITSIATLDEDNVATIYSSNNYYTITSAVPGEIVLKQGITAPYNSDRSRGGYRIIWLAGYGADIQRVPAPIREAMKAWVIESYDTKVVGSEPPVNWARKLSSFRVSLYAFSR